MTKATTLDATPPVNEIKAPESVHEVAAPQPVDEIKAPEAVTEIKALEPVDDDQLAAPKGILVACGIGIILWAGLIVLWMIF